MQVIDNCPICLSRMAVKDLTKLSPCLHLMHSHCFQSLALFDPLLCPLCRSTVENHEYVPHKQYSSYNGSDRRRIVQASERIEDWKDLAASLQVCLPNINRLISYIFAL